MNGLHLVCSPSINSFKVDGRKTQKGHQAEINYSAKPFRARSFSGSNVQHQFHNRTISNKVTKLNEVSGNSSHQSSITCNDSSAVMSKGSNATEPSAMFIDCSGEDKSTKRNTRKKARKKVKHKKKHLCDIGSSESEVCSEHSPESSLYEICNDVSSGVVVSCATSQEVSPSNGLLNITDFVNSSIGGVKSFKSQNLFAFDNAEVDLSGSIAPSEVLKISNEHQMNDSGIGSREQRLSSCQGDIKRCPSNMGSLQGIHQKDFSDVHDSLLLDSVSVGSNSEDSMNSGHIVNPFNENHEIIQSELPGSSTRKGSFYHQNSLCSISGTHNYTEGTKNGVGHSSYDGVAATEKKGKQFKSIPGSLSTFKLRNIRNLHSRMGTENSHSVWQRVQKNAVERHNTELKKASPICSQFNIPSKNGPLLKRNFNAASITTLSIPDDKRKMKNKVPKKLKRKVSPASKQENSTYSRKESHWNKVKASAHAKASMPKSEILDVLTSLHDHGVIESLSTSSSQHVCARVETMTSESVNNFQVGPTSIETCESVCDIASSFNDLLIENQDCLLKKPCIPLDPPNLLELQTTVCVPHLMVNSVARTEKEISLAENSKQSQNLGSVLQKWIPIGIKDHGFAKSARSGSLSFEHSGGPDIQDRTSKSMFEEKVAFCHQKISSAGNAGTICSTGMDSRDAYSSLQNKSHTERLRNLNACVNEILNKHNGVSLLIDETKEPKFSAVATDLNNIAKALNDAYRAQMASEAVQMATGGPIAEFERLLHFSSPVICHSYSSVCQTCFLNKVPSALLCRHETPNIPLGRVWQWYEKHGSYGLEIRAEDHENPKRFGVDQFEFRAYFVPFLSAVQLFRNSNSCSPQNNTKFYSRGVSEACDTGSTSRNSTKVGHLPILSALVPQPRASEQSRMSQVNDVVGSEPSSVSPKDGLPFKSDDMSLSACHELVFEYFESEQPQQRRALYETIEELVKDNLTPRCKMYGDPVYLNSINIQELHPQSWYSVAWYPIYRIPGGNFRAAFLTYHSLGHLVRRSSKFDPPSMDACIVSPVVGLQSYNAQGECWFQTRHSVSDITETQGLSPSGILKERLRTLKETASLMARAVVKKGNETSVNRHPDYEFFLSRQH